MVEEIIKFLGGGVILLGAVSWLLKSVITQVLSKSMERHREILKIEAFKLSRLHEKRGLVITDLYSNLDDLVKAIGAFVNILSYKGDPSLQEKHKIAGESYKKFRQHYDKHRIFFSEDLCERIDTFVKDLKDPAIEFAVNLDFDMQDKKKYMGQDTSKAWSDAYKKFRDNIPAARKAIENEFRAILGVTE
jgi:hypothetical protein